MVSTKPNNNKQKNTETLTKAPSIFERNKLHTLKVVVVGGVGE